MSDEAGPVTTQQKPAANEPFNGGAGHVALPDRKDSPRGH